MAQSLQKEFPIDKIRTIALIGHGGSGKTTFSEAILFSSGMTNRLGKADDGSTVSDYHPDEIERKISINSSLLHCEWRGTKLNVLDTPGYSDFTGEVIGALRVADLAVVFLKAVEGVEVGTEIVWGEAKSQGIPAVIVINKLDNENALYDSSFATAKERFGSDVTAVQFPVNEGLPFDAIVDVLQMKMIRHERDGSGKFVEEEIPADLQEKASALHEELIEKIAETNEDLLNAFLEEGTLPPEKLELGFRQALLERKIFPVYCTAASMNIGLGAVLDMIVSFGP
ncbi:MAG: GTP-binding protein, partial [Proteobacteria bacterium]|nr:GTP-binding protein [Pseudomonadota bacterium]